MKNNRVAESMGISFQPELFTRITDYCAEHGCSISWFVNKAAEFYLNECLEDKADYEAAVAAWEEFEKSGGKTYTSEDLRAEFGL